MKKKLVVSGIVAALMLASAGVGAYAATKMTLIVDGKVAKAEPRVINGTTYVPVRAAAELLGAKVNYDSKTNTVTITSAGTPAASKNTITINKVTTTITKVEQDSDSLRVYVTYKNGSSEPISPAESLSNIVSNGKQLNYEHEFNFNRYYDTGVDKAPNSIEPGVTAKSVLFFPPVANPKTINIVLKPNYEEYRFTNIAVKVVE